VSVSTQERVLLCEANGRPPTGRRTHTDRSVADRLATYSSTARACWFRASRRWWKAASPDLFAYPCCACEFEQDPQLPSSERRRTSDLAARWRRRSSRCESPSRSSCASSLTQDSVQLVPIMSRHRRRARLGIGALHPERGLPSVRGAMTSPTRGAHLGSPPFYHSADRRELYARAP
jgi:hypothetical protein